MINIQRPKTVECSVEGWMGSKVQGINNFGRSLEPSYAKLSRLSLGLSQEQYSSRIKSGGLSSTKSRGLSLSMKKQKAEKKQCDHQNIMINPESVQDSGLTRRKTASTLVRTSHTIHHLGRSLSKSKEDLSKSIFKAKNPSNQNFLANFNFLSNSLRNLPTPTPQRDCSFSLNQNKHYTVKITPPKQIPVIDQSQGYSQQSNNTKQGKIHSLRKKDFLRSSKKQNHHQANPTHPQHLHLLNPPPCLKTSSKHFQVKNKREFLESYIQKPMINSIILSGRIDHLTDELESPVLRLKKRLELNSINCIYEKQTLVSNEIQDNKSSTIEVQESLIVHRNVAENIRPLMHKMNLFSEEDDMPYKLYLGQEVEANLVVTVKEIPHEHFEKFARELRIYQEIQSHRMETENFLELIKHSTDSDKHVLLKQPFTETLHDYLENYVSKKVIRLQFEYVVESVLRIVKKTIDLLQERGMVLKRKLNLSDFVFVFTNLKFENLEMFELGGRGNVKVKKEEMLEGFRQEIENYCNRISCGSLQF